VATAVSALLLAAPVAAPRAQPAPARAGEADGVALDWVAPAGCPGAGELRARIAEAAGGELAGGPAWVRAARRADGRWVASVRAAGRSRELVGDTCGEVAAAAAVIVGLALRAPAAPEEPGEPASDDEVPPGATLAMAAPRSPGTADPLRADRVDRSLRRAASAVRDASASFGAHLGALGVVAPYARFGAALRGRRVAASVEGSIARGEHAVSMPAGQVAAQKTLLSAGATGCLAADSRLWLCAGAEAGRMAAEVSTGMDRDSGAGLWLAAHAGPSASWPIGGAVDLVIEAEAVVPLAYPRFRVNGQALADGPAPVGVRSAVGLRLLFP
jgi:hypothetical protein